MISEVEKSVEEKVSQTSSKGRLIVKFDPKEYYGVE